MPIVSPKIPQGLEELMRGLAKSVIKENPENIYEFAAEYFENLLRERDGSVDQRYKKFATYKVYKKSKATRKQRDKELKPIRPSTAYDLEQGSSSSKQNSDYDSIEKIILPPSHMPPREQLSVSSESEINASVKQEAFVDVEGATPARKESSTKDEDENVEDMILDDEMEQAALKIQSTFRGHKVRRDMKDSRAVTSSEDIESSVVQSEVESEIISNASVRDENGSNIESNPSEEILEILTRAELKDLNQSSLVENIVEGSDIISSDEGGQENTAINPPEAEVIPSKESIDDVENKSQEEICADTPQEEKAPQEVVDVTEMSEQEINEVCDGSEIERKESVESEKFQEIQPEIMTDDEEIANMVMDGEMEEAALKIQSAFRGHKVRKEMKSVEKDLPQTESLQIEDDSNDIETKIDEGLSTEIIDAEDNLNEISKGIEMENEGLEQEPQAEEGENSFVGDDDVKALEQIESIESNKIDSMEGSEEILMIETQTDEQQENEILPSDNEKIMSESSQERENVSFDHPELLTKTSSVISNESVSIQNENDDNESSIIQAQESVSAELENDNDINSVEMKDEAPLATESDANDEIIPLENKVESVEIEGSDVPENEIKSLEEGESLPLNTPGDIESEENLKKEDSMIEATGSIECAENESFNAIVDASLEATNDESPRQISTENPETCEISNDDVIQTSQDGACLIDAENTQRETSPSQDEALINDDVDKQISVEEEVCVEKIISNLEPEEAQLSFDKQQESFDDILGEDKKASLEKMSSTEIKYEKLQESVDGGKTTPQSIERQDTEEKSIDADSLHSSKRASVDDEAPAENLEKETIKLEQILQSSISPIDLIDEVVNEKASLKADEIFGATSSDVEAITKPELINLNTDEIVIGEEMAPIVDEILTPEKEESEIPDEETQNPIDEPLVVMDQSNSVENVIESQENSIEPTSNDDNNLDVPLSSEEPQENLEEMILDDEMEEAAVKIQAAFRGHKTRKETLALTLKSESEQTNQNENNADSTNIVIDQCSEANEETQDQDDTEMQDTSADVDEIQESEAVTAQDNQTDEQEEETTEEEQNDSNENENEAETAEEGGEGETNEDDPDQADGGETSQANEDDDVANMVLDDEMEQAALKIQSTFRGHKTRKDIKTQPEETKTEESETVEKNESADNLDDDIANMVLDDEMEQAALKIQSTFRGHKVRKDKQNENESEQTEPEPEESKKESEEEEPSKPEEEAQSSSTEGKSAQQLQDEEDIANLVMDEKMEETALKIQSAFRGKFKRKQPKDNGEEGSYESSAENGSDYGDESPQKSEESPADIYEYFGLSNENASDERGNSYDEVDNNYSATRQSYEDDARYSVDRYDSNEQQHSGEAIYPLSNKSEDDINLMQGGGIFVEPSHESPNGGELLAASSAEDDKDPNQDGSTNKKDSIISSHSNEEEVEEKEEIKVFEEKIIEGFDFEQNRDTAEALYYSLKKNEIEAQKRFQEGASDSIGSEKSGVVVSTTVINESHESVEEDNDDVVVLKSPTSTRAPKILKYGMSMDDRLLGSILSQDYSQKPRKIYPDENFDPLLEESMRNHPLFLERLHEMSQSGEGEELPIDFQPDNMGDEDQFDDFYPGNIRSKIMASSISIADSDFFDPTNNKSIIDDDMIRTALETIHSTDSESTIASAATKIQAGERHNLMTRRNNNQYSSIGNAAIDKSLDDFIQSQEMRVDRFDEEPEGSCVSPPPSRKQESNDDTCTSDTCTESDKKHPIPGIKEIKLEQKPSHFLTVDERRRTLHREDAIQRNSTRSQEEDSSKSSSSEKIIDKNILQSDAAIVTVVQGQSSQSSIIDTEITVPVLEKQGTKPPSNIHKLAKVPIIRQKTMPVQIESNIIRVLPPKHLRKRIKSAESSDKRRKTSK